MDIIRPKASDAGLKVPVIMDASPYYSTLGRGNESELKRDLDGDGLLDRWPLFYDNYFVPRGYAVVLLDMVGTNNSTGCPQTGDPSEHLSAVAGIDWLNGRRPGYDKDGNVVFASWHNGKTGMIGKSYDGTLANGAASTGVDGLSTIVPISAISSWYDYVRSNGLRVDGQQLPVVALEHGHRPGRPPRLCDRPADARHDRRRRDGRLHAVLGGPRLQPGRGQGEGERLRHPRDQRQQRQARPLQQVVVRPGRERRAAQALGHPDRAHRPVRLPPHRVGQHAPPLVRLLAPGRGDADHEGAGGRLRALRRDLADRRTTGPTGTRTRRPLAPAERDARRRSGRSTKQRPSTEAGAGDVHRQPDPEPEHDDQHHDAAGTRTGCSSCRRRCSPTCASPARRAPSSSRPPTRRTRTSASSSSTTAPTSGCSTRHGDGLRTLPLSEAPETCWGEANPAWGEDACYLQTVERRITASQELVTKGILDAQNRNSYATTEPLVVGQSYPFNFPLLPEDYVFKAGHRIGDRGRRQLLAVLEPRRPDQGEHHAERA